MGADKSAPTPEPSLFSLMLSATPGKSPGIFRRSLPREDLYFHRWEKDNFSCGAGREACKSVKLSRSREDGFRGGERRCRASSEKRHPIGKNVISPGEWDGCRGGGQSGREVVWAPERLPSADCSMLRDLSSLCTIQISPGV